MSVVYAKICPKHIEATSFAILAGVSNFSHTISSWVGSWINEEFVGVKEDDLSQYWLLVTIQYACCFLPLLFLWLIPTRKQIEDFQESIKEEEELNEAKKNDGAGKDKDDSSVIESTKESISKDSGVTKRKKTNTKVQNV